MIEIYTYLILGKQVSVLKLGGILRGKLQGNIGAAKRSFHGRSTMRNEDSFLPRFDDMYLEYK
jgi:hypothetical protein